MKLLNLGWSVALSGALSGGFCTASVQAQPDIAPGTIANLPVQAVRAAAPRPGTPREQIELDLKGFLGTLNALSREVPSYDFGIPSSISGARIGYFGLSEWRDFFVAQRGKTQYQFDRIEVEWLEKDAARVKIFYSLLTPNNIRRADGQADGPPTQITTQSETLALKRETVVDFEGQFDKWRIVPPDSTNCAPIPFWRWKTSLISPRSARTPCLSFAP